MDAIVERWAGRVRAAATNHQPLRLRGGGSKDFYGQALAGELLDTREYAGIVAYEPTELVVTARCGTPLAELQAVLAAQGQSLSFEPPHFSTHFGPGMDTPPSPPAPRPEGEGRFVAAPPEIGLATLGGCVAAGLSGPRRAQAGAVRDFVLGVKILDGRADVLNFGGQVMKNVAGYDVPRLMAGSLGTLGLILEVSLKVLPFAVAEQTLRFALPQGKALTLLNQWSGQPLPISGSAWIDQQLYLRLSGAAAAVGAASEKLGGEPIGEGEAAAFWHSLREQTHAFFAGDAQLWRLAVPSASAALDLPGAQLIEWGGAQRWLRGGDAAAIRAVAGQAGGHATLFRADAAQKSAVGVFTPLSAPLARIHRQLKRAFDPQGVFNPGRMYPDF
jgi:glycolate oxidase FAD binding subunit